jgi:solute carrier family 26 protein
VFLFQAREVPGIKIFHYCGGLNFATRNHFKTELYRLVGINPRKEVIEKNKMERSQTSSLAKSRPEEARVRIQSNCN